MAELELLERHHVVPGTCQPIGSSRPEPTQPDHRDVELPLLPHARRRLVPGSAPADPSGLGFGLRLPIASAGAHTVSRVSTRGHGYRRCVLVQDVWIMAHDGERLAGTLYLPVGDGPFAAVMEALPYRKDDVTESYRPTYERYAAHGLAVLRIDLRGTGSSSGICEDEYPDVERSDLRTAIEWLAAQPWSNGRVGMFGTSYSGFNSLQMAAEGVPALGAVVATYATDDRYTDDVHYCGGVLRAIDLIDYPLYMVAMNALPPVPAVFGDGWRDEWRRRIDHTPPWLLEWLLNPTDGPTWRRGSIRLGPDGAGYERMACPTMLIVGWADGYRNNSFRVVEQYERNGLAWRMLAGPWVHKSPERARPGPNVDDDVDVLAFFDQPPARRRRHPGVARPGLCPPTRATRAGPRVPPGSLGRHRYLAGRRAASRRVRLRPRWSRLADRRKRRRRRRLELVRRGTALGPAARSARATTPGRSRTTGRSTRAKSSSASPASVSACGPITTTGTSASSCATSSPTGRRR